LDHQRLAGREQADDAVGFGRLEGLLGRERRQNRGQPPGQHRFDRARQADEQAMVANRPVCYDLGRPNIMALAISYSRYSMIGQADGDSERRQKDPAVEYCRRHGHKLLDIRIDRGQSGYYEANLSPNAELGKIREDVRQGRVPRGTLFLIESYDRMSRADIVVQLALFAEFLLNGISIVNLRDGSIVSVEILAKNPYLMFSSLGDMARANQESAYKVFRDDESGRKSAGI